MLVTIRLAHIIEECISLFSKLIPMIHPNNSYLLIDVAFPVFRSGLTTKMVEGHIP